MAKTLQLSLEDIKQLTTNPINGHKWTINITSVNKHHIKVDVIKTIRKCFGCRQEFSRRKLFVRQDSRVTKLYLKKLFCKVCVIRCDFILDNYKPKATPHHLKKLNRPKV